MRVGSETAGTGQVFSPLTPTKSKSITAADAVGDHVWSRRMFRHAWCAGDDRTEAAQRPTQTRTGIHSSPCDLFAPAYKKA
jgi:hypothetical protein